MKRNAVGAIGAQGAQALGSFVLQILVVRLLGLEGLGTFSILYGVLVLVAGILTGFVGDSLVVLDRRETAVRSALQQSAIGLSLVAGIVSAIVLRVTGLITWPQAVWFAVAVILFGLEELMRRLLMANVLFWRVAAIDLSAFLGSLAVVGMGALLHRIDLDLFLIAIALGQVVAILLGVVLLPRAERFLAGFVRGEYRLVAAYGLWRSAQQFLRPGLLTGVRSLVTIFVGLAATGLLETARVYVAPAMLIISGLTSFLFVSYARNKAAGVTSQLRRADRSVGTLLGITTLMSVVFLVALPFVGPLLFGTTPQLLAVIGWLAYAASVSAVTPYGALAAVGGRQAFVFAIRVSDTLLSIIAVAVILALGLQPSLAPIALSIGSIAGGLAIRAFILKPEAQREQSSL
ncbi:hypothetical protein F1C58_14910 [Glaciihabitans sp. INWT7]|uniref:hypothetical protein n=1 Tax=Glaciihabitans sp. INWT7 TaxID=2596912 RepID=UPI0016296CA5|nr:hypothetical protein [Glaciihabitans sp. INWT7]QNE48060.1 hypothetical protein F1C58_14910 [Glaciihabitans sp. INWT7]